MAGAAPGFVVRTSHEEDLPAVVDLWEAVVGEGRWVGRELPLDREDLLGRMREALGDDRAGRFVAVAGDDGVVGHLAIHLAPYDVAELGMCVAAGWRGRGVGSALVAAALDWARRAGAHKVALQVWPHNRAALALYRKFGFVEEGRLRRHYPRRNGELWDVVVMGLVLDEDRPGSSMEAEQAGPGDPR